MTTVKNPYFYPMSPQEIDDLEQWFAEQSLPKSYRSSRAFYLEDVQNHLKLEFAYLRNNLDKPFLSGPVIERLQTLKRHFNGELSYPQE